jgi:hypothetical protein
MFRTWLVLISSVSLIFALSPLVETRAKGLQRRFQAPEQSVARTPPAGGELIIPAGTELQLTLQEPLSSKLSEPGDEVLAILRRDITADGMLLLRRGTEFIGRVTLAAPARRPFKGGQLHVTFDRVRIDGHDRKVSLVIESVSNFSRDEKIRPDGEGVLKGGTDGGKTLRNVGTAAAFGMTGATIILLASAQDRGLTAGGAVAGAGIIGGSAVAGLLLTSGKEIRLDQNSMLRMKLERSLRLE